jgi:hypothetical protein
MKERHGIAIPDWADAIDAVLDFWTHSEEHFGNFREAAIAYYRWLIIDFQDAPSVGTFETVNILERIQTLL